MGVEPLRHSNYFNPWQYKYLRRCAELNDMTRWNQWREKHPDVIIRLEGADFESGFSEGIFLRGVNLEYAILEMAKLQYAKLDYANLQKTNLIGAQLQHSWFWLSNLKHASLDYAYMQYTNLINTNLKNTSFHFTLLKYANISHSILDHTFLQNAKVWNTEFKQTKLLYVYLNHTDFRNTSIDRKTVFLNCIIDHNTDFRGVALDIGQIDHATKTLLKCNIRRLNWKEWYKEHKYLQWPWRAFWWISDFGKSPVRLIGTFFSLSFFFAMIYLIVGRFLPPGLVENLFDNPLHPTLTILTFFRALYFSIVTTTTLGFGDMYAQDGSIMGHILLSVQVIIGYFILGALITYLGILYNTDGPAGKYAEEIERDKRRAARWQKITNWFRRK